MTKKNVSDDLVLTIEQARRSVQFCTSGTLAESNPGLEIEGVGPIKVPLRPKGVREILAAGQQAPYGKGTKTIVDPSVRDTLEINPKQIALSEEWNAAIESATQNVADELGLPTDRLQAKLYKLLIYQKGGFFLPHRDSEKLRRMVGSLIVMLPSSFGGGELIVEHADEQRTFAFEKATEGKTAEYVAFYADCQHEVRRVTRGVRVCLAYNLVVKSPGKRSARSDSGDASDDALARTIAQWVQSRPSDPMVFALEHQYTASGLKPDLLKGNDRAAAKQIAAAAEQVNCRFHFGQVSRHLLQFADDGSFGLERRWSGGRVATSDLDLGEVYEDEVIVDGWKDARGKRVSLGALELDSSMLVSKVPMEQWKPTSEDYEGYTGNAGNTLDRWYHKSAIVLWSNDHHFDVLVRMGIRKSIETFLSMRAKLIKTPEKHLEQACNDCESLARAIISRWPQRFYRRQGTVKEEQRWLADFAVELPRLEDPQLVGDFLQALANRDWLLNLDKLVMDSCRRFDADAMAPLLSEFLAVTPGANQYGRRPADGLPARDAAWLSKLACDRKQGGMTTQQLARLLRPAVDRFCDHVTETSTRNWSGPDDFGGTLLQLLKATLAAGDERSSTRLLERVRSLPTTFDLRSFQVRAVLDLLKWSDKRFAKRPAEVDQWLAQIRAALESATSTQPQPPTDFARNSQTDCHCEFCRQLSEFLQDPTAENTTIKARKDQLQHLEQTIRSQHLDASSEFDRTTRPFGLLLTKTTDSYRQALKRYHEDLKQLSSLPTE